MKFMKLAALLLAMVVGLAGGVSAGEFNRYGTPTANLTAYSFSISSPTAIGGDNGGMALAGQDRRLAFYVSSTDSVAADVWGARSDGLRLTKLGAFTATSASTPTSMTVATIVGYQKVIISPTNIGTGNNVLTGMVYQVK